MSKAAKKTPPAAPVAEEKKELTLHEKIHANPEAYSTVYIFECLHALADGKKLPAPTIPKADDSAE